MLNGMVINRPTSFRNEVNADYKNIGQGYSIPDDVTDESVPVDSTAIQSARYDPYDDSLDITYKNGNKEYKFKADGSDGLEEWRYTHRYPGY